MINRIASVVTVVVAVLGVTHCRAVDGTRINGRAVSANWRYCYEGWAPKYQDANGTWKGAIEVFNIVDGRVAGEKNVIYPREQGLGFSPRFDMNGCRIAFYRLGRAASTDGSRVEANGGRTTISVIDHNGENLVNLADCPGEPLMYSDGTGGLQWPGGEWIYYLMPKSGGGRPNEVWRVNASTSQNEHVCTFDLGGGRFRRFSMNVFADRMGCQVLDGSWFTSSVQQFPNGCSISGRAGGCNSVISASGNYHAKFMGDHRELLLSTFSGASGIRQPPTNTNYANLAFSGVVLYQFQDAIPDDRFGDDVEGVNFSGNSDKWALQHVGWHGHADLTSNGSEQVACNWADMAAIRISNNGRTDREPCPGPPDCCGGCGTVFYGNSPGDLWVDGGPENAGKYEDADGNWHSVPGAPTRYCPAGATGLAGQVPIADESYPAMNIVAHSRYLTVSLPVHSSWHIRAVDSKGRVVAEGQTTGRHCTIDRRIVGQGAYVVHAQSSRGELSRMVVVD